MADNLAQNGTGTVRTDDVGGVHIPYTKLDKGGDGASSAVTDSNPLPVLPQQCNTSSATTSFTVGTTATDGNVLTADSGRKEVHLQNDSDTIIYLGFGRAAELNKGYALAPNRGNTFVSNVWTGSISAISSAASKKLLISEFSTTP